MTTAIFRKDVRRLWPHILFSNALLASAAWMDTQRYNWTPGLAEGYLNLLVPGAWFLLVALAVQQDGPANDRAFWLTRPLSRPSVFAAKALFALCFVHLPFLIAQCWGIASHGFQPLDYWNQLAINQVLLGAALTLPAIAIAAACRNIAQCLFTALALAAVAAVLMGIREPFRLPWILPEIHRRIAATVVLAAGAALAATLAYRHRRVSLARVIGGVVAALAALCYFTIPYEYSVRLRCALAGRAPELGIAVNETPRNIDPRRWFPRERRVPLRLQGLPADAVARLVQVRVQVTTSAGDNLDMASLRPFPRAALLHSIDRDAAEQLLYVADPRQTRVNIDGAAAAFLFRQTPAASLPLNASASVPSLGICSAAQTQESSGQEFLRIHCESPERLPAIVRVRLVDTTTGRTWDQRLADAYTPVQHPAADWLSPLYRSQTVFHIVDHDIDKQGSRWVVHRAALQHARIEIQPEEELGCRIIDYSLRDVLLR